MTTPLVSPGIQLMAPDNMACLVPDVARVTRMPNSVTAEQKIQFIPNAYQTKPEVALNDKKAKKKSGK